MAAERAETDPILTSLMAKVAAWQAAVDSYRAAKAMEQGANGDSAAAGQRGSIELPINAFRGMTLNEAIKLFLKSVQRKQSVAEIAQGLKSGGFVTTSKDFGPNVRSALNKLKADGVLLRFSDGWDLAESHSAMIRHRVTRETAKPAKRRGGARKSKAAAKQPKPTVVAPTPAAVSKPAGPQTLDTKAQTFLAANPFQRFTAKQIADALGLPDASKLILSLSRMVRYKKAEKDAAGHYSIVRAA